MAVDVVAEVLSNTRLSSDYNVLALAAPDVARQAQPGQFVMLKTSAGLDPLLRRPFSIFEHLRDASGALVGLSILNKNVGVGTSLLFHARQGDRLSVLGPLGRPFVPVDPPRQAWMVAGGVGLAPFVTLAEALAERRTPMTLFYGARSARDLYYASLFEQLGCTLVLATEDGTRGEAGRVTLPLQRALATLGQSPAPMLYACGPTPMMRAVATLGASSNVPVSVSLEPAMGCGMGGCYSCVVPIRQGPSSHFVRACLEGPVFDATTLVWDQLPVGH
jgi:dihydroorotate dehydrogenase electron transfer subunit